MTGGAGFIGSHLVDKLVSKNIKVKVLDNLSTGNISFLSKHMSDGTIEFIRKDLKDLNDTGNDNLLTEVSALFHLAAYPDVRSGFDSPHISYNENIRNTFYLLERIRKSEVQTILFASTSTVYGEAEKFPTPEDYGPLLPISPYGGSKLACEALISSYCHTYGIKGVIFRLANVIGPRSRHGVIWDFIEKLKNNKNKLEILGDGSQSKSYIHVSDCVDCFCFCLSTSIMRKEVEIFNVGSVDQTDVISIAKAVCRTMNLNDVQFYTRGETENDGRGWVGDLKKMLLDISKLRNLGWNPRFSSMESVSLATKELLEEVKGST